MARILVTGGAGFLGSHLVDELLNAGHGVVALDDLSGGCRENVDRRAQFVEGSILDHGLLERLFAEHRFEYVFHLAAYAAEGLSHFVKRFVYTRNLVGSVNLINLAVTHRVQCFVFTSSIAVYGSAQLPFSEDLAPLPEDTYGISKYTVELELEASRRMFGLDYIIFRPHNVFGERQNLGDPYRNVVGIFMNRIMQGKPVTIFGDGSQTRAFSHYSDVVPAIARSIRTPAAYNRIFNIGADTPCTVAELLDVVARQMGARPEVVLLEARKEVRHAVSDHRLVRSFFDLSEPLPLEEGIARMARWARQVGPQEQRGFGELEITRNLPPGWT